MRSKGFVFLIMLFSILLINRGLVSAIDLKYTDFYKYLIDLKDWKASKPTGSEMKSPMGNTISSERTYRQGDREMHVEIVLGQAAYGLWTPFTMGMTFENDEELFKTTKIKGLPAGLNHRKKDKNGAVLVLLTNKPEFVVLFMINYLNMEYQDVLKIAEQFPLEKLHKELNKL
ncbi:MAG: hypothetical protein GXO99_04240 [Nitrospirae bacterium]|nr:hypothetical protein [Nitrospirota bacterium]